MSANLVNNALRALARTAVRSSPGVVRSSLRAVGPAPSAVVLAAVKPSFSVRSFTLSAYRQEEEGLAQRSASEGERGYPIFVGNIPWAANSSWLRTLFKQFGEVDDARLVTADGRSRGFGFVHFKTAEARDSALRMDGREVEGRVLVVAESNSTRRAPINHDGPRPDAPRGPFLVLDNLGTTTRMSELLDVLRERGLPEPTSSRLIVDRRTGLGKGHAYLDFDTPEDADKVLRSVRDEDMVLGAVSEEGERKAVRAAYANPRVIREPIAGRAPRRAYGDGFGGGQ